MAYETLDDINTSEGIHTLLVYAADTVPIFIPLTLFAFFIVVMLGSYFAAIRLSGRGDFPSSFAAAGFLTAILSTVMTLLELVNLPTLSLTYGLAVVGIVWVYFSRD